MTTLTENQFQELSRDARVLESDARYGDKVLLLPDNTILKLFKLKKGLLSSSTLLPYARRFINNVAILQQRDIPTLEVITEIKTRDPKRHCVHYNQLIGTTLRERYKNEQTPMPDSQVQQLGRFLARLHDKGIYFRSVHLGNIVATPDGELGLIDVADMKVYSASLNQSLRLRNFAHLIRCAEDLPNLDTRSEQGALLINSYIQSTSKATTDSFIEALQTAIGLANPEN